MDTSRGYRGKLAQPESRVGPGPDHVNPKVRSNGNGSYAHKNNGYSERMTRMDTALNPPVAVVELDYKYSLSPLKSYNPDRHIPVDQTESMIKGAGLKPAKLQAAVSGGEIKVYDINGKKYLDRLDIGRVYHEQHSGPSGLRVQRYFTRAGEQPLKEAPERYTDVTIEGKGGAKVFHMDQVEVPKGWDEGDLVIVAQKYFHRPTKEEWKEKLRQKLGRPYEFSPKHLINRVTNLITDAGIKSGYFATEQDAENYRAELARLQIDRKFAFNSPVQFNAGIFHEYGIEGSEGINFVRDPATGKVSRIAGGCYIRPQAHACFIKGPSDDLESILQHVVDEGAVFSCGSGIGQNIGVLREEGAKLSGGGKASGPMSFFSIYDRAAGSIKSGGKSRRAARMTVMDQEHPDVMMFVQNKLDEDQKCLDLMKAGWSGGMDGEAATTVQYQNTNISVRVSDEFFRKVQTGEKIKLHSVKDGGVVREIDARELLKHIAFGSWRIGDPALQYRDMIDQMHTSKNSGRIWSSNPCSEYLFLNDTSCNLASTNLANFATPEGDFDIEAFRRANRLIATGCDILNNAASYPVKEIAQISPEFRTIGVGYAGLGNLLMRKGVPYNSEEGRTLAGAITALMTGTVYEASTEMAEKIGTFTHYELNKRPMLQVMSKHKENLEFLADSEGAGKLATADKNILEAARKSWKNVMGKGAQHGFRNAQATVLAPTGTISYLMGCSDSTGVEPGYQLQVWKNLAGGGGITITNREIPNALKNLGYRSEQIEGIMNFVGKNNTVVGAPYVRPEHLTVFETAAGSDAGIGAMPFEGHVRMLGATQPFISGAISKTCNLPNNTSVKQMFDNYILGNQLGLKAMAMFRANSKPTAALGLPGRGFVELKRGEKEELPTRRQAWEWETKLNGTPIHMIVSEYQDGRPGQIAFLSYKAGSTLGALLRNAGVQASAALKRGVELEDILKGWIGNQFEPQGIVSGHPLVKTALSPLDLAGKVLAVEYLGNVDLASIHEDKDTKIDLTQLRGAQNGAFRTYARRKVDDWDFNQVVNDPELGGFNTPADGAPVPVISSALQEAKRKMNGNGDERGLVCTLCGFQMRQTGPGCFFCTNCPNKIGGCGM